MTRRVEYTLLLAAAIGLPMAMTVAGCRARPEIVVETTVKSPTRTAASADVPTDEAESEPEAESSLESPVSVSQSELTVATPREILTAAGAVVELDKHGRTVGVDLTAAHLSAEVTRAVAELTELQWVDMRGARITDADLAMIATLPRLELLALGNTLVTDAGMKHLQHQQDLRFLSLDGTAVTDTGLGLLKELPRLEGISLSETAVSKAGAKAFAESLPDCKVMLDSDAPSESPAPPPVAVPEAVPAEVPASDNSVWNLEAPEQPSVFPEVMESTPVFEDSSTRGTASTGRKLNELLQRRLLDAEVLQALGQHLMAQKSYAKAATTLEALVAMQPANQQARFDLGVAMARSGQFEDALPHLTAVVGDATACYNLGIIAHELDRPARSEWYLTRAIDQAPDFVEAQQWLDRVRNQAVITPASHAPPALDRRDLVNLLMSELGASASDFVPNQSAAGIEIVPAAKRQVSTDDRPGW